MQKFIFVLLFAVGFLSCKKNNTEETATQTNIYAAGYAYNGNDELYAFYWKNGTKIDLTPANPGYPSEAEAMDITLHGNDVYACGYEYTATGKYRAVYWKNGVATKIYNQNGKYKANALYVQ